MFTFKNAVRYALYPLLLLSVIATIAAAIRFQWNFKLVYGLATLVLVFTLAIIERIIPLDQRWSMTGKSFLRDLKYIVIDAPTIALAKTAFGIWAIYYSERHPALLRNSPLWLEVVIFLVVFEFFQYWYHRLSHEAPGKLGSVLWRVHVAHHLPDRVYVVMHAVFNPINALISAAIVQAPLILLGVSPAAALAASLLIDLQSLVSHFNVELRAGFLNYIFIGTETHRYHHSASREESGNFGNTLALWDLVFGTFVYRPGVVPQQLGVENPSLYPDSSRIFEVVTLPFRSAVTSSTGELSKESEIPETVPTN